MKLSLPAFLVCAVALALLQAALFIVPEGMQAVVVRFGAPRGEPLVQAGLYFKVPFIDRVRFLERRIQNWDGEPNEVPTKDQKFILVDASARWRISDALTFIRTLTDERMAAPRISSVITSATRDTISAHNLVEAVRSDDSIFEILETRTEALSGVAQSEALDLLKAVEKEKLIQSLERVSVGRQQLSGKIAARARQDLKSFGIELIDVQLMRVAYNQTVEQQVYKRMMAEQQQIAGKIRSSGLGEQQAVRGKLERDLKEIESLAYKKVQEIKGQADAEAARIYAEAIGANLDLYEMFRTAEAYRKGLKDNTTMVLSSDSEFFKLLQGRK